MNPPSLQDRFRGCLVGGACGDALGYPIEFIPLPAIQNKFGMRGVSAYQFFPGFNRALVSDDTQMTMFTANGLLCCAAARKNGKPAVERDFIRSAYMDWLYTQHNPVAPHPCEPRLKKCSMPDPTKFHSWLMRLPWIQGNRAPGRTCISALESGGNGTFEKPLNNSKGCGGVMRTAPAGLYAETAKDAMRIGAEAAVLTHGDPLGYIPAGAFSDIVYRLVHSDDPLKNIVNDALADAQDFFKSTPEEIRAMPAFISIMKNALDLGENAPEETADAELISRIGLGWVGEEALAIAVLCALRHEHDFAGGIVASVNHSGDSDSTGAVAGNLLGARMGLCGIPRSYAVLVEGSEELVELADDLLNMHCPDESSWMEKYV